MKHLFLTLGLVFSSITLLFAQTKEFIPASDSSIRYSGRTDNRDPENIVFAYPGVSIKAKFEGTSISAYLTDFGTNYFYILIDGVSDSILVLSQSKDLYELASGLTDSIHTIEIFKRTETSVGKVAFKGFLLDPGKKLLTLDPISTRSIEFIGNSITCGYGNEVSTNNPGSFPFTPKNENNYLAWGAVAARTLNAEYSCIAYSGKGLYQNYGGEKTGTLPLIYDRVIADDPSLLWDYNNYIPDVVVINLGTNDFSAEVASVANTVDSAIFVNTYIAFINKLRSYYPSASIICCVGVMMSDSYPSGKKHWTRIQRYVSSVCSYLNGQGDAKVFYLKLDPQTAPYGEDWHPTIATNARMATTLVNFIDDNINWNHCPASLNLGEDINLKYTATPIILNSQSTQNTDVVYTWYKDDVIIEGATGNTLQINDTSGAVGIYKVVRDSVMCRYEDKITITNEVSVPITEIGIENASIVYPVPSKGSFYFNDAIKSEGFLEVIDINARNMFSAQIDLMHTKELDARFLKPGIYYILFTSGNEKLFQQIIIE